MNLYFFSVPLSSQSGELVCVHLLIVKEIQNQIYQLEGLYTPTFFIGDINIIKLLLYRFFSFVTSSNRTNSQQNLIYNFFPFNFWIMFWIVVLLETGYINILFLIFWDFLQITYKTEILLLFTFNEQESKKKIFFFKK